MELESGKLVFEEGGGETGVPREKPLGAEYRTNNKLKPQSYEAGSRN